MPFFSPLRYPGGKGRLGSWLSELLRHNSLSGGCYYEPYAGGAGAALHLLLMGYVDRIMINDLDPAIYSFWWAVLNNTDELLKRIHDTSITIEERNRQLHVYSAPDKYSITDLGFAALLLNRTSRSGILTGGVIGGKSQSGEWLINARFNKTDLSKRIQLISDYTSRIEIYNLDAINFIDQIPTSQKINAFIYLDPPYYHKGGELYRNAYTCEDHKIVSDKVRSLDIPWIVTYDDCPEIEEIYNWANGGKFKIYYSASHKGRRQASEVIYYGGLAVHRPPYIRR